MSLYTEELWVETLNEKPPRIVGKITFPCIKLSGAKQDFIIVTGCKENAAVAVLAVGVSLCLPLRCNGVLYRAQFAKSFVATCLKAIKDGAKRLIHFFPHKKDTMKMIWHHLQGDDAYLWMACANVIPAKLYGFAHFAKLYVWGIRTAKWLTRVAGNSAE